jgi:hypothetical protein
MKMKSVNSSETFVYIYSSLKGVMSEIAGIIIAVSSWTHKEHTHTKGTLCVKTVSVRLIHVGTGAL